MGILSGPIEDILALRLVPGFRVVELGDQWVTATEPHRLAHDWYRDLGCGDYVSIDANGRGTVTWDLNQPLEGLGSYDLVTDFGTGEHIFNQAQVWQTMHDLCVVGGFMAWDRPSQGYPSHCYYRVDPCLYDDLAAANGYRIVSRGQRKTPRGVLERGVWRRMTDRPFVIPQQGRYRASFRL